MKKPNNYNNFSYQIKILQINNNNNNNNHKIKPNRILLMHRILMGKLLKEIIK
jgi:hypothetical protein